MEVPQKESVSGDIPAECKPEKVPSPAGAIWEEFFPGESEEGSEDISQEWLSIFVEDCLSGSTSFTFQHLSAPTPSTTSTTTSTTSTQPPPKTPLPQNPKPPFQDLQFQAKARTKRKKTTNRHHGPYHTLLSVSPSDPPLLHQTQWLADSELILPKKEQEVIIKPSQKQAPLGGEEEDGSLGHPRRCTHCLTQRTPQWRGGPLGPKTLCNACGVRYKSGRLLPEYRPAKSPTFVSYKHSNSHKKVMEMRSMAILSSTSN